MTNSGDALGYDICVDEKIFGYWRNSTPRVKKRLDEGASHHLP